MHIRLLLPLFVTAIASSQTITTFAGNGTAGYGGDGGPATQAEINDVVGLAADAQGNIYMADQNNNRVRKVTADGVITTFAGTGASGFAGDGGPATQALLNLPTGVCVSPSGDVYVNDNSNHRVRKIAAATGIITTVAGDGSAVPSGDGGFATSAGLEIPIRCAVDSSGNLYIVDQGNSANVVRKVNTSGIISTYAGVYGGTGYSGDGGPATSATMFNLTADSFDASGNLYLTDQGDQRIRVVNTSGIINTVAGTGTAGYSGDGGPATAAELNYPGETVLDSAGNLFIVDSVNQRIRKVSGGTISTVAGTGTMGYAGDGGPPSQAEFSYPFAMTLDNAGNLYIGDNANNRVRKITGLASSSTSLLPVITAVENAANYQVKSSTNPATPNSIISVYVSNLGAVSGSNLFPATDFLGVQVLFNGTPAPLYYANGAVNLINLAVPSNLPTTGTATLAVQTSAGLSSSFTLPLAPTDVGIFRLSADPAHPNNGAVTIANSQWLVMPASTAAVYGFTPCTGLPLANICGQPASIGSNIVIYLTGGGLATPDGTPSGQPIAPGSVAPVNGSTIYETVQTPTVTIGGASAPVEFSGIAPGTAAEYQINTTIPVGAQTGDSVPVVVTFGSTSDTVTIAIQ